MKQHAKRPKENTMFIFDFIGDVFGWIFDFVEGVFNFLFGWIF
jgi:hypothetical protein